MVMLAHNEGYDILQITKKEKAKQNENKETF